MGNCGASQDTFTEVVVSSLNLTEPGALGAVERQQRAFVFLFLCKCKASGQALSNKQELLGPCPGGRENEARHKEKAGKVS